MRASHGCHEISKLWPPRDRVPCNRLTIREDGSGLGRRQKRFCDMFGEQPDLEARVRAHPGWFAFFAPSFSDVHVSNALQRNEDPVQTLPVDAPSPPPSPPAPANVFMEVGTGLQPDLNDLGLGERVQFKIRQYFEEKVPWRSRLVFLALIVGLLTGVVCMLYEVVMDFVIHHVWTQGGPAYAEFVSPHLPPWTFILLTTVVFGGLTGVFIRLLGEPMANLPGVVLAAHRDGLLGYEEAPAMAVISISSITAGGSLGPEAPLVSIGGGLASFIAGLVDLSEAETLFITMCGMGAGLAAFFGEPVGGALFACEVLHRYGLEYYEALIPTVIAGLSCNWAFRVLANLPQEPIWTFAPEEPMLPWSSVLGLVYGMLGGLLGWAWMRGTNLLREKVMVPLKLGPKHITKGLLGGLIIGLIGILYPQTLFWAEFEAQTIIDGGATPLPHVFPQEGVLGAISLVDPAHLLGIGIAKLVAISITVLAGYRGGFIFPFMFAGHSIGTACFYFLAGYGIHTSQAAAALSVAAAINVAVTRTVLATPIVLSSLSGRTDVFPHLLVASLVALWVTGEESIIKAARKRWLRAELEGTDAMTDRTPTLERRRLVRSGNNSAATTPGSSLHGGNFFAKGDALFAKEDALKGVDPKALADKLAGPKAMM